MEILYGNKNNNITQLAILNCMNNNIITIPKDEKIREEILGQNVSQNTIKINNQEYEINQDLFIDTITSQVYTEYPHHLYPPKIVVLIICHYSDMNMMMLDQLRNRIYKKHNLKYYIVASRFSETGTKGTEQIELDDDIIFVNQKETYFNILNKTLKAMEYINNVLNLDYDFMIRTNVSTVINIPQLLKELSQVPKQNICIGGNKMQINWTCSAYGINDNRYKGRWFVQGTSIIFSKDVCADIIKNQHKIEKTIVDDISLFMYLANFNPLAYESINKHTVSFYECCENIDELHKIPKNLAFYRNKTENMRDDDIIRMRFLCNEGNLCSLQNPPI
jgi:hypothetical protein